MVFYVTRLNSSYPSQICYCVDHFLLFISSSYVSPLNPFITYSLSVSAVGWFSSHVVSIYPILVFSLCIPVSSWLHRNYTEVLVPHSLPYSWQSVQLFRPNYIIYYFYDIFSDIHRLTWCFIVYTLYCIQAGFPWYSSALSRKFWDCLKIDNQISLSFFVIRTSCSIIAPSFSEKSTQFCNAITSWGSCPRSGCTANTRMSTRITKSAWMCACVLNILNMTVSRHFWHCLRCFGCRCL